MGTYEELGIRRIVNCIGPYTLLGGPILWDEVRAARDEADRSTAWIWDIQQKVGNRIAKLLGAEAVFVPVGVFAGMAQCVAALMAGVDPQKMEQLPNTKGMKDEVIVQKCLRDFKYDRSITITGAKIVEVGDEKRGCTSRQIVDAITDKTAAIHYMSHGPKASYASSDCDWVHVDELIGIGKRYGVPVLVDAAFQCYPLDGLTKYTAAGADAAIYSCKYFGGPNTAGIIVGKKSLIDTVALHSFIGQEGADRGEEYIETGESTYCSLFRGCKQDRGSIVGAVVALEKYLKIMEDPEKNVLSPARERAEYFLRALEGCADTESRILDHTTKGIEGLRVAVKLTLNKKTSQEVKEVKRELTAGDPEIWLDAKDNSLIINITWRTGLMTFDEEDKMMITNRIKEVIDRLSK